MFRFHTPQVTNSVPGHKLHQVLISQDVPWKPGGTGTPKCLPQKCLGNPWKSKKTCPGNAWKPQKVPRKLVEPPDFKPEIWLGSCKSVQKPILGVKGVSKMDMTETESWLCRLYTSKNFRNSGSHSQRRLFGKECKGNQHLIVLTLACLSTVVSLWVLSEPAETLNSSVT